MTRDPYRVKARCGMGELAMMEEEDLPRRTRRLEKLPLDLLGVAELNEYIDELRAEITRVEADIARKQSHKAAADAFFRKP